MDSEQDDVVEGVARDGRTLRWFKLKALGAGSYGVVHKVKPLYTHDEVYAVKSCPYRYSSSLHKEYQILKEFIACPTIIQCYGDMLSVEHGHRVYNLFLEFASGGTLSDLILKNYKGKIPESHARRYARMVVRGVRDIHARGYVHCDIKPENILVYPSENHYGEVGSLKIADFGLARRRGSVLDHEEREPDVSKGSSSSTVVNFLGTPLYMPPECVNSAIIIDNPIDIWSVGCVVLVMITGKLPWECEDMIDLAFKLVCSNTPELPDEGMISREGVDFLMKCFARDPAERWSAEKLLSHPFLNPNYNSSISIQSQANFSLFSDGWNAALFSANEAGVGRRFDTFHEDKWLKLW